MPQLDQFTYLTQFVWLCVFFMSFYVLIYNDALPKISRILKLRKQLVSTLSSAHSPERSEKEQDVIVKECLNISVSYLFSSLSKVSQWCTEVVKHCNYEQLQPMNKSYISSCGEMSAAQVVKKGAYEKISLSPRSYDFNGDQEIARMIHKIILLRQQSMIPKKKRKGNA